jgi:NADPH:quinone reductase
MKALMCERLAPDFAGVVLRDADVPVPQAGDVLIKVHAASLNFPDLLMTEGKYQFKPELPFTLGMECAGTVAAVGADVTGWAPGDAVVGGNKTGAFADFAVLPARGLTRKPAGMSFAAAAAFSAAYLTAWVALVRRANLQPGETLLVHGASGGVGMAAIDLGKHLGAVVIATSGSDAKLAALSTAGADHVLNATRGFREPVKALTGGRGADVIFDPVGGDVFDESVRCIAFDGRLLVIGFTSGRIPSVDVNLPLIKGFSVVGVRAGEYGRQFPARGLENMAAIWDRAGRGVLNPKIHACLPLSAWRAAFDQMAGRQIVGKLVIAPEID